MRTIFLGATKFSAEILKYLISHDVKIEAVFYIPEYFSISYSNEKVKNYNFSNIQELAKDNNIQAYEVDSVPGKKLKDYKDTINSIKPDVILVMGWFYLVSKEIRNIATYGAWGIHASLLPRYAGGAPLVWAIINGEKETGVSLFKLNSGVDDGDIIKQKSFKIRQDDSIKEVYEKATEVSKDILYDIFVKNEEIVFTPQDKSQIEVFPQRKPEDGKIDWNWSPEKIKNFIRAQTKPYPGAWTIINNKRVTIWDADICQL